MPQLRLYSATKRGDPSLKFYVLRKGEEPKYLHQRHRHDDAEVVLFFVGRAEDGGAHRLGHFDLDARAGDRLERVEDVLTVEGDFEVAVGGDHVELLFGVALFFASCGDEEGFLVALESEPGGAVLGDDHGAANLATELIPFEAPRPSGLGGNDSLPVGILVGQKLGDDLGGVGGDAYATVAKVEFDANLV